MLSCNLFEVRLKILGEPSVRAAHFHNRGQEERVLTFFDRFNVIASIPKARNMRPHFDPGPQLLFE
jgi:hypothetical protein